MVSVFYFWLLNLMTCYRKSFTVTCEVIHKTLGAYHIEAFQHL